MAKLLGLNENYFIHQLGDRADVHARFNYYPCCSRPDLVLGIRPHSDGSFVTILLLDKEVEGLQVLKDGEWFKVPITPHALVFNLGNQMEVTTSISIVMAKNLYQGSTQEIEMLMIFTFGFSPKVLNFSMRV